MPQRRAYATMPMGKPNVGATGRSAMPPSLGPPPAQPFPPSTAPIVGQASPMGGPMPSASGPMPLSPMPPSAPSAPSAMGGPQPQAPGGAMPLSPMSSAPPRVGTGTVGPLNIDPFLTAQKTGSMFNLEGGSSYGDDQGEASDEAFRTPYESKTTAAMKASAGAAGDQGQGQDQNQLSSMLLKLLGVLHG